MMSLNYKLVQADAQTRIHITIYYNTMYN